jgi:hypothetical protein
MYDDITWLNFKTNYSKNNWSEQSFAGLGLGDWCSALGLALEIMDV